MSEQYAVKVFTRDPALLSALDEPLRRQACEAEWLQDLTPWSLPDYPLPRLLLVVDLDLVRNEADTRQLEQMTHHAPMLLTPPLEGHTPPLRGYPAGSTLLADRSTQRLAAAVHRLLGIPGRAFPRHSCEMSVEIQPQDASPSVARCGDISFGGMFIESSCEIPPGNRVSLRVYTRSGLTLLACDGCVAWQRSTRHGELTGYGAGIQFLFPDSRQLQQLVPDPSPAI